MAIFYRRYGKRAFDIVVAAFLLLAALPLFAVLIALVRVRLGSPVFFTQKRGGHKGRPLEMVKFRSMTDARTEDGVLMPDEARITPFGNALRAWSLDELPQLLHVLRGEMSLIGPRPFIYDYIAHYTPEQMRRHDMRPGMTGLAQVMGRNSLSWDDKFHYDIHYVDNVSFAMDLKILWRTIGVLFGRVGVSADGHATMPTWQPNLSAPPRSAVSPLSVQQTRAAPYQAPPTASQARRPAGAMMD